MSYAISRIGIPARVSVKSRQPMIEAHWDTSAIRWKWYYKGLRWLLRKLGAVYVEQIPECWPVQYCEINHASVISMLESGGRAMRELWSMEAAILILGPEEYGKLMSQAPPLEWIEAHVPVKMARTESLREKWDIGPGHTVYTRTCKLRVICVPWLEGWAILPDLNQTEIKEAGS
jgi:hypothetical protein